MQDQALVIEYATLFKISTKNASSLIGSFVGVIKNKHPDEEITSLEKEGHEVIFILKNGVKVKFSPPDNKPVFVLPYGYSDNKYVSNFYLCSHLYDNRNLFTKETLQLLEKYHSQVHTKSELAKFGLEIAKALKIPFQLRNNRCALFNVIAKASLIIDRILSLDKQGIVSGSKVELIHENTESYIVLSVQKDFYLRLRGRRGSFNPKNVIVIKD